MPGVPGVLEEGIEPTLSRGELDFENSASPLHTPPQNPCGHGVDKTCSKGSEKLTQANRCGQNVFKGLRKINSG